jgi:hypothetical protein
MSGDDIELSQGHALVPLRFSVCQWQTIPPFVLLLHQGAGHLAQGALVIG